METSDKKPWYKRVGLVGVLVIGGLFLVGIINSSQYTNTTPEKQNIPVIQQVNTTNSVDPIKETIVKPNQQDNSNLSNDNYYTNTAGNIVHSPAYSNSIPAGASARCGDGTYSFSQSRRGTCSHHGGVAEWL